MSRAYYDVKFFFDLTIQQVYELIVGIYENSKRFYMQECVFLNIEHTHDEERDEKTDNNIIVKRIIPKYSVLVINADSPLTREQLAKILSSLQSKSNRWMKL